MNSYYCFVKYAYPCIRTLQQIGRVTEEDVKYLDNVVKGEETLNVGFVEDRFVAAFRRIKKLADCMGKDYRDIEVIRQYFLHEHNRVIDKKEGTYAVLPESICDVCKVRTGYVETVNPNPKNEVVKLKNIEPGYSLNHFVNFYGLDLSLGDKVSTHYGFIIEKLE